VNAKRSGNVAFPSKRQSSALITTVLHGLHFRAANIHNIALNAAFLAAQLGGPVTMRLVLDAARSELRKLDRPIVEADFRWQRLHQQQITPASIPPEAAAFRRDRWCRSLDYYFRGSVPPASASSAALTSRHHSTRNAPPAKPDAAAMEILGMNITLHIERLILDGCHQLARRASNPSAVEAELTRLLLNAECRSPGTSSAVPHVRAGSISLAMTRRQLSSARKSPGQS